MPSRVQTLRSSVAGSRPAAGTREVGELYVNFADRQIGMIDAGKNAIDLLNIRFFATTAAYVSGEHVTQAGKLYRAKASVSPGAFNAGQWDAYLTLPDLLAADGLGSGLDADLLDSQDGSYYTQMANMSGTINDAQHGVRGGGNLHAVATPTVAGFFTDAPNDGVAYVRRSLGWVASSVFIDAPSDAKIYGRQFSAGAMNWVETATRAYIDSQDALKLPLTGGTLTGNLSVQTTGSAALTVKGVAGDGSITMDKAAGTFGCYLTASKAGSARWQLHMASNNAESGSNAGSDFVLYRFSDAGASLGSPFSINRASGAVSMQDLALSSTLAVTGSVSIGSGGNLSVGGGIVYTGSAPNAFFATGAGISGTVYLRPNGYNNGAGEFKVAPDGQVICWGAVTASSNAASGIFAAAASGGTQVVLRPLGPSDSTQQCVFNSSGNITITGPTGVKSTGTTWANPSDARIKNLVGDYPGGLDEILALKPRVFTYKGNDTPSLPGTDPADPEAPVRDTGAAAPYTDSPHHQMAVDGTEVVGFIAQEVEETMPDMVKRQPGWIDGVEVDDFRIVDTNNLIFALVNAVKTLEARVAALEAV